MKKTMLALVGAVYAFSAQADLATLSDDEMAHVDGAGMALVLENFVFEHAHDQSKGRLFKIGGIKNSRGQDVQILVSQLYIAREGSNYGEVLAPVNLGRLTNPYRIDVVDGNTIGIKDKAVVEIAAPSKVPQGQGYDCFTGAAGGTCSSRPASPGFENGERPDMGLKLEVQVANMSSNPLNIHAQKAVIDGTRLRIWGQDGKMASEFKLNFYTPQLTISACEDGGGNCGKEIKMHNFGLELALGNALQPMYLDVNGEGHFVFEVKSVRDAVAQQFNVNASNLPSQLGWSGGGTRNAASNKNMWDYFKSYYENPEYRSNLHIGKLEVVDRGGVQDFGSARIEGMLVQYMKITSHDLAR